MLGNTPKRFRKLRVSVSQDEISGELLAHSQCWHDSVRVQTHTHDNEVTVTRRSFDDVLEDALAPDTLEDQGAWCAVGRTEYGRCGGLGEAEPVEAIEWRLSISRDHFVGTELLGEGLTLGRNVRSDDGS